MLLFKGSDVIQKSEGERESHASPWRHAGKDALSVPIHSFTKAESFVETVVTSAWSDKRFACRHDKRAACRYVRMGMNRGAIAAGGP